MLSPHACAVRSCSFQYRNALCVESAVRPPDARQVCPFSSPSLLHLLSYSCTTGFRLLDLRFTASIKQPEREKKSQVQSDAMHLTQGRSSRARSVLFLPRREMLYFQQAWGNSKLPACLSGWPSLGGTERENRVLRIHAPQSQSPTLSSSWERISHCCFRQ